ncbi:hypothetical protein Poli38472_010387 [Pythium oligandrum]|uniref:Uncharacterized protein n=1 Tax=Pythium oligandrum TaxID=41045 RepID=A0A8K1C314_PYTOL|nr:hypothetical protein Poli38472_010387 [Pythium oligandrum]|eukprot:TMW55505.1 hypothetical protein Poli38472_010387 [Pythium oligandrum]
MLPETTSPSTMDSLKAMRLDALYEGKHNEDASASDQEESDLVRTEMPTRIPMGEGPSGSMDDTYLRELLGSSLSEGSPASRSLVRRSKSCGVQEHLSAKRRDYRIMIGYRDESLRERFKRNTESLLRTAMDDAAAGSNSAILARKALKYRRILERMEGVDLNDSSFDVSECLGVRWQHVSNNDE